MTFQYHSPFPLRKDETPFRKLDCGGVRLESFASRDMLVVEREAIRLLAEAAMIDINHLLRPAHLAQLAKILDDPEASANDKFVAYDLLKNANIAAGERCPCARTPAPRSSWEEGQAGLHRRRRCERHRRRHQGRL